MYIPDPWDWNVDLKICSEVSWTLSVTIDGWSRDLWAGKRVGRMRGRIEEHDGFDCLLKDVWDVEGVAHKNDNAPQDVKPATVRLSVVECWLIDLFVITSPPSLHNGRRKCTCAVLWFSWEIELKAMILINFKEYQNPCRWAIEPLSERMLGLFNDYCS